MSKTNAAVKDYRNEFLATANKALAGKRIAEVRYMTSEEAEDGMGWHSAAPVLVMEDGMMALPMRDDEGNDAGALILFSQDGDQVIPVVQPI